MKPTIEEMDDFMNHCLTVLRWPEVQAVAGKWSLHDEQIVGAIRRTLQAVGEWVELVRLSETPGQEPYVKNRLWALYYRIRDFGEEGK